MDDSLLPFTSLRENLIQAYLDFSYFRTTEPKLLRLCARCHSQAYDTPFGEMIYFINKPAFGGQFIFIFYAKIDVPTSNLMIVHLFSYVNYIFNTLTSALMPALLLLTEWQVSHLSFVHTILQSHFPKRHIF